MRIRPNIYFRRYGEHTYIRDVEQAKDYLLNESAFDILDFIDKRTETDLTEILAYLEQIYEGFDPEEEKESILDFAEYLMECGILEDNVKEDIMDTEQSIKEMIQEHCSRAHQLMTVCLELTYRCNERCVHCYIDDPTKASMELGFEDYKKILDELRSMGCMSILLTGGEPTLHKDFLKIAFYAKQIGLIVDIYTNGLAFSEQLLDALVELKPNSVSFSLYGGTAGVHDAVTKIPGSFEKSLKSMMMCKCAGLDTYIKTVVMRPTAAGYEELRKLGRRLNIDVISSLSVMDTHKGQCGERFRLMDEAEYQRILEIEYRYGNYHAGSGITPRSDVICFSGLNTLSVDPFGEIHPCNAHPMVLGNVRTDSIKEIWDHSEQLRSLREVKFDQISEKCHGCADKDWCGMCMGSAIRENGKLAPCSDTCIVARANHKAYEKEVR